MNGVTGGGASFEWFDAADSGGNEPTDSEGSISRPPRRFRAATPETRRSSPRRWHEARASRRSPRGLRGVLVRGGGAPFAPERRARTPVPRRRRRRRRRAPAAHRALLRRLGGGRHRRRARRRRARARRDPRRVGNLPRLGRQGVSRVRLAEPVRPRQGRESVRVAYAASLASLARASAGFLQRANEGSEDAADGLSMSAYESDLASLRALVRGAVLDYPGRSGGGGSRRKRRRWRDVAAGGVFPSPRSCAAPPTLRAPPPPRGVADPDQSTAARVRAGGGRAPTPTSSRPTPPPPRGEGRV